MTIGMQGGDKLTRTLELYSKNAGDGVFLRLGFLEGSTYPDGTPTAYIAAINEFGNPAHNQPPRPYFRQMIAAKSPGWGASMAKVMKANGFSAPHSLSLMGEGISGQLQESIRSFSGVPLAPSTVAAKGFDKQLIDTGHMASSVGYEIKDGA